MPLSWFAKLHGMLRGKYYIKCDGVRDDVFFNEAYEFLPKNPGGELNLQEGEFQFSIVGSATAPSYSTTRGSGPNATVRRPNNSTYNGPLIKTADGATGVIFEKFLLDGNCLNQDRVAFPNQGNLRFVNATDSKAVGVFSIAGTNYGIYLSGSVGCEVLHCVGHDHAGDFGASGAPGMFIGVHRGSDNVIANNICRDNEDDGIAISESKRFTVANNVCFGSTVASGIEVYCGDLNYEAADGVIEGNDCYDNARAGIELLHGGTALYDSIHGLTISGNTLVNNGTHGLWARGVKLTIAKNVVAANVDNGICLFNCEDTPVEGNVVYDNNTGNTAGYSGIFQYTVGITIYRVSIQGNTITNAAPGRQKYGINIADAGCADTVIGPNTFNGNETAPINDAGTRTKFVPTGQCARVYHDADQLIANGAWTVLNFNSERFDNDDIHDTVVNNNRLTCKTAGIYEITAQVQFATNGAGERFYMIRLNGAIVIADTKHKAISTVATQTGMTLTTLYQLSVNDWVEVLVYQNSGGALNVVTLANYSPEFMMVRAA